jgi:hypothetical protein
MKFFECHAARQRLTCFIAEIRVVELAKAA